MEVVVEPRVSLGGRVVKSKVRGWIITIGAGSFAAILTNYAPLVFGAPQTFFAASQEITKRFGFGVRTIFFLGVALIPAGIITILVSFFVLKRHSTEEELIGRTVFKEAIQTIRGSGELAKNFDEEKAKKSFWNRLGL